MKLPECRQGLKMPLFTVESQDSMSKNSVSVLWMKMKMLCYSSLWKYYCSFFPLYYHDSGQITISRRFLQQCCTWFFCFYPFSPTLGYILSGQVNPHTYIKSHHSLQAPYLRNLAFACISECILPHHQTFVRKWKKFLSIISNLEWYRALSRDKGFCDHSVCSMDCLENN